MLGKPNKVGGSCAQGDIDGVAFPLMTCVLAEMCAIRCITHMINNVSGTASHCNLHLAGFLCRIYQASLIATGERLTCIVIRQYCKQMAPTTQKGKKKKGRVREGEKEWGRF